MSTEQELKQSNPSQRIQNLLDKDFKDRKLKENEILKLQFQRLLKFYSC